MKRTDEKEQNDINILNQFMNLSAGGFYATCLMLVKVQLPHDNNKHHKRHFKWIKTKNIYRKMM